MIEFNFKSQIATTIEQSERLITLGLRKETADMVHYRLSSMNAWVKGWESLYCSYKVEAKDGVISSSSCACFMYGLSFPTPEMANEFIETFKDLLETAKPLL